MRLEPPPWLVFCTRSPDQAGQRDLLFARDLAARAASVTVFLVEGAVEFARAGNGDTWLDRLDREGIRILVDRAALAARGVAPHRVKLIAHPSDFDAAVARLSAGFRPLWL